MPFKTTKNAAYDNAVSLARFVIPLTATTAGSGGTSGKYYARGNEILWSVGAMQAVAGTSTYTTTDTLISGGTSTTVVNTNTAATAVTGYRVSGTSTTTLAAFTVSAANSTNGVVALNNWTSAAGTATGGGIALVAGDLIYCLNGTDTTATSIPLLEMSIAPLANVSA